MPPGWPASWPSSAMTSEPSWAARRLLVSVVGGAFGGRRPTVAFVKQRRRQGSCRPMKSFAPQAKLFGVLLGLGRVLGATHPP